MHQIHLWKNNRSAVLQIAIVYPLGVVIFGLFPWYALTDPELTVSERLASLVMVAIILALLRVLVSEIVLGRALETYLLSRRTLAIVRKGRPTRFVKPHDLSQFHPRSDSFVLRDGRPLTFHIHTTSGSKRQLAEKLVTLWYGESAYKAIRDAYRLSHFPQRGIATIFTMVLVATLLGVVIAGWYENRAGLLASFAMLAALLVVSTIWTHFQSSRFRWKLGGASATPPVLTGSKQDQLSSPSAIKRFPKERPRLVPQILTYTTLLLVAAVTFPVCRYLMYIPQDARRDVSLATFAIAGALFALYIAGRCYETLIRGDLFTTVILSPKTFALVHPRKPVRYLKRADIVAFAPNAEQLILSDGTKIDVGLLEELGDISGPMDVLWCHWWNYVPEERRKGPDFGLGIGWKRGTFVLGVLGTGIAAAACSDIVERELVAGSAIALLLLAFGYYFYALVRKYRDFRVSLHRDDHGDPL
jgi:hypothetical protein